MNRRLLKAGHLSEQLAECVRTAIDFNRYYGIGSVCFSPDSAAQKRGIANSYAGKGRKRGKRVKEDFPYKLFRQCARQFQSCVCRL